MISHDHRCIFVHIPHTAGTSIEVALTGEDWFHIDGCRDKKHLTAQVSRDLYRDYWDDYFTFSIVRNPFDRLVSRYACFFPWGTCLFSDFIFNGQWYADWEPSIDNQCDVVDGVDKVYRFEDLGGTWADISERLGVSISLPHVNRMARQSDWSGYYERAPGSRDYVAERCSRDLRVFGYSFS